MIAFITQFLSAFLAVLVVTKSYTDFRRGKESRSMFLFWTIAWIAILLVAFFPNKIDEISFRFGGRGTGVGKFLGMALVFVFFVVYRIYVKADRIERMFQRFVKEQALKDLDLKPKSKN